MIANGDEKPSCVELAQELYESVKEKGYSEELIQNAFQLMKKLEKASHELNNVPDYEEEELDEVENDEEAEENMPDESEEEDYSSMSEDEMRGKMAKKGIITIRVGSK